MSSTRHDPSHASGSPFNPNGQGFATGKINGRSMASGRRGTLSIIVPAKNEEPSLPALVAEIAAAFRPLRDRAAEVAPHVLEDFEILIVDDGSTDATAEVLRELAGRYPELRPILFETNAGQSAATLAGFRQGRGDWIAILDADLQNPPSELARLWDALPGHDAGLGWRIKREDRWSKKAISRVSNRVRHWVLGDSVKDTGCAVRIFPREVALRFPMFHGAHRFYGPLLLREGCRIVQLPVEHRPRPHGTSHYNLWNRSLNVIIDLLGTAWLMRRPVRYRVVGAESPVAMTPTPTPTPTTTPRSVANSSTLSTPGREV